MSKTKRKWDMSFQRKVWEWLKFWCWKYLSNFPMSSIHLTFHWLNLRSGELCHISWCCLYFIFFWYAWIWHASSSTIDQLAIYECHLTFKTSSYASFLHSNHWYQFWRENSKWEPNKFSFSNPYLWNAFFVFLSDWLVTASLDWLFWKKLRFWQDAL